MPHTVFDERGGILLQTGSDIEAIYFARARQKTSGKLTTVLMSDECEVLFAPAISGPFKRAETAIEHSARTGQEVGPVREFDHDVNVSRARRTAASATPERPTYERSTLDLVADAAVAPLRQIENKFRKCVHGIYWSERCAACLASLPPQEPVL